MRPQSSIQRSQMLFAKAGRCIAFNFLEIKMAIVGIASLLYGVEDVKRSTRFFTDFGLPIEVELDAESRFRLDEGSTIVIRKLDDPSIPRSVVVGDGVREVVWGVDTPDSLSAFVADLRRDREVNIDDDGTAHFLTDCGLAMALRVFHKTRILSAPDAVNSPGNINRFNQHRKWRRRARPKTIQHVVFAVKDFEQSFFFMRDRLGFRLSDYQRTYGIYMRAEGANNHHNIFFLNANLPFPEFDGEVRFHHANYGVEDIDEIMVGANHMERQGWERSHLGLGRHRVDSALFFYLPCPAGGEAEYGTDGDFVDDTWVPRDWFVPSFGYISFVHNLPDFLIDPPEWEVRYFDEFATGAEPGYALSRSK